MIPPLTTPPFPDASTFASTTGINGTPGGNAGAGGLGGLSGNPDAAAPSFSQELNGALRQMEQLQTNAEQQVGSLLTGHNEDVHASMIAVEKADLAFGMMLQLRNKAVEAYQDISHMSF